MFRFKSDRITNLIEPVSTNIPQVDDGWDDLMNSMTNWDDDVNDSFVDEVDASNDVDYRTRDMNTINGIDREEVASFNEILEPVMKRNEKSYPPQVLKGMKDQEQLFSKILEKYKLGDKMVGEGYSLVIDRQGNINFPVYGRMLTTTELFKAISFYEYYALKISGRKMAIKVMKFELEFEKLLYTITCISALPLFYITSYLESVRIHLRDKEASLGRISKSVYRFDNLRSKVTAKELDKIELQYELKRSGDLTATNYNKGFLTSPSGIVFKTVEDELKKTKAGRYDLQYTNNVSTWERFGKMQRKFPEIEGVLHPDVTKYPINTVADNGIHEGRPDQVGWSRGCIVVHDVLLSDTSLPLYNKAKKHVEDNYDAIRTRIPAVGKNSLKDSQVIAFYAYMFDQIELSKLNDTLMWSLNIV